MALNSRISPGQKTTGAGNVGLRLLPEPNLPKRRPEVSTRTEPAEPNRPRPENFGVWLVWFESSVWFKSSVRKLEKIRFSVWFGNRLVQL